MGSGRGFPINPHIILNWSLILMAKKKEEAEEFDLEQAIEEYPKPDWYKLAFTRTMDTSKIKSQSDLEKAFKTYGEMK